MKILTAEQIAELDLFTIKHEPVSSIDLMERAAIAFTKWFSANFLTQENIVIICGPGNNGGDGLAIGRLLLKENYKPRIFFIKSEKYSKDFLVNKEGVEKLCPVTEIDSDKNFPSLSPSDILIDAIFGTGLNKPAEGLFEYCIKSINESSAKVVSVDIASGLFADKKSESEIIVKPRFTITFQLPKLAFFLSQNDQFVGSWNVVDIGIKSEFIDNVESPYHYTDAEFIKGWVKKRGRFSHKGTYGKSLIIGGSYGMIGAAVLAAKACLRTGSGLCTTYSPKCGYEILQTAVPENIVITDPSFESITQIPDLTGFTGIGIGPGLREDEQSKDALKQLLKHAKVPLVIDAGALNLIAADKSLLKLIPAFSILTPHPKEFERLTRPVKDDFERLELLKKLASEIKCFIVLKGAFTVICTPEGNLHFNSTGNPGMAKAGSGDVLTGIITSLLSQGFEPYKAAILGVYIHGYAGDVAAGKLGEYSINATDIIDNIHSFFKDKL